MYDLPQTAPQRRRRRRKALLWGHHPPPRMRAAVRKGLPLLQTDSFLFNNSRFSSLSERHASLLLLSSKKAEESPDSPSPSPSTPTIPFVPRVTSFPPAPVTTDTVRNKCRELLVVALQTDGEEMILLLLFLMSRNEIYLIKTSSQPVFLHQNCK